MRPRSFAAAAAAAALLPSAAAARTECTPAKSAALLAAIRAAAEMPEGENLRPGVAPEGMPSGFPRHAVRQGPLVRVTAGELSLHGTALPPLEAGGGESIRQSLLKLRENWGTVGGGGPHPTFVLLVAPGALRAREALGPLGWSREGGFPDADLVVTDADEADKPVLPPAVLRRIASGPRARGRAGEHAQKEWAASLLAEMAARCAVESHQARDLVRAVFGIRRQGAIRLRLETRSTPVIATAPVLSVAAKGYDLGTTRFTTKQFRAAAAAVAARGDGETLTLRVSADAKYGDVALLLLALDERRRGDAPLRLAIDLE